MTLFYQMRMLNKDKVVIFTDGKQEKLYKKVLRIEEYDGKNVSSIIENIIENNIYSLEPINDMEAQSLIDYMEKSNNEHLSIVQKIRRNYNIKKLLE